MTSIEAYKRFELKVNKLDSADNIDISPGEFVLIYNEQQDKWYERQVEDDETQALVNIDQPLTLSATTSRYGSYNLPDNYLDYIRSYILCSRSSCTGRLVRTYQVDSPQDIELYLRDEHNKPSLEYQETPITISTNKMQVYKTDFSIDSVFLTYYRYPIQIDIAGYKRTDGTNSTTVDPELNDEQINRILDLCALETQRSVENPEGFQLSRDRITNINKQQQ